MKFYKVLKDTFLWEEGAILKDQNSGQYVPVDDVFNKVEDQSEYISAKIVEKSPEWFERVYAVDLLTKTVYKVKAEAKLLLEKNYKE